MKTILSITIYLAAILTGQPAADSATPAQNTGPWRGTTWIDCPPTTQYVSWQAQSSGPIELSITDVWVRDGGGWIEHFTQSWPYNQPATMAHSAPYQLTGKNNHGTLQAILWVAHGHEPVVGDIVCRDGMPPQWQPGIQAVAQ